MDPPDSKQRRQRKRLSLGNVALLEMARECVQRFPRNLIVGASSQTWNARCVVASQDSAPQITSAAKARASADDFRAW